ncbi:hypothetical protein [Demequina sp. NBRC 110053]|uniref:hypothetical protein n=1 Tax=Demequina sp. NBRC 110053 TaxID=1570342 RepID=UPI0009FBABE4|nr:hypothetical protein [Demequina sp. NBRC 110053]
MSDAQDIESRCDYCGKVVSDRGWIGLEVSRPRVAPEEANYPFPDYLNEIFCSQEHAALWLQQPLPDPEPVKPYVPSWRERLMDVGLVSALVVTVAFAAVGLTLTLRWLLFD